MVPPRAPDPGQRLRPRGASRRGGRWAPHGRPGVRRRARAGARGGALPPCLPAALPAAAPAARRGPDCQRRPRAGMRRRRRRRRAGGRGGGPGAGRGWGYLGGPSGPGHPPGAGRSGGGSGRPGPRDWASPGSSPDRRPGARGPSPLQARLAARRPARPLRGAATQLPGPRPGLGDRRAQLPQPVAAGTAGPPSAPRLAPPPPPGGAWEPDPGRTGAAGPERCCRSHAPSCMRSGRAPESSGSPGLPPPGPSLSPGQRVLWPSPSLALTSLSLPGAGGSWTGPPRLRAAWDSGPRLRESETWTLASLGAGRALSNRVLSKSLTSLGLRFLIQEINIRPRGRSGRKVFLNFIIIAFSTHQVVLCVFAFGTLVLFTLPSPTDSARSSAPGTE